MTKNSLIIYTLTLKRLGYFEGSKDWGGYPAPPLGISAIECPIATKFGMDITSDVLYKLKAKTF